MERVPPSVCTVWIDKLMLPEATLSADEQQLLHDHLQDCDRCRQEHQEYQRLLKETQLLQMMLRPPDIKQKIALERRRYLPGEVEPLEGAGIIMPLLPSRTSPAKIVPRLPSSVAADGSRGLAHMSAPGVARRRKKNWLLFTALVACLMALLGGSAFFTGWFDLTSSVMASSLQPQKMISFAADRSGWVHTVSWSPNGRYVASVWEDNTLQVWDALTGREVFTKTSGWGYAVAWSPDSTQVAAVGEDDSIQIWQATTGNLIATYSGHTAPVNAVAWSPDGKYIASASEDRTVQIWPADQNSSTPVFIYKGHNANVTTVAWSPDGRRIASGDDSDIVQVWDAFTGDNLLTYGGHHGAITSVSWSPDSHMLVSASYDGTAQVWDARTGNRITTYNGHRSTACANAIQSQNVPIFSVAWSPASRGGIYIASASFDGTVQVWTAKSGDYVASYPDKTCAAYTNWMFTVAWSPDGTRLVTGGKGNVLSVNISDTSYGK